MIEILAMTAVHARTYVQTLAEEQGSPKAARRVGGGENAVFPWQKSRGAFGQTAFFLATIIALKERIL